MFLFRREWLRLREDSSLLVAFVKRFGVLLLDRRLALFVQVLAFDTLSAWVPASIALREELRDHVTFVVAFLDFLTLLLLALRQGLLLDGVASDCLPAMVASFGGLLGRRERLRLRDCACLPVVFGPLFVDGIGDGAFFVILAGVFLGRAAWALFLPALLRLRERDSERGTDFLDEPRATRSVGGILASDYSDG